MAVFKVFCVLSVLVIVDCLPILKSINKVELPEIHSPKDDVTTATEVARDAPSLRSTLRPGMLVASYAVDIEPNVDGGTFSGTVLISVIISDTNTMLEPIIFHIEELNINSIEVAIGGTGNYNEVNDFDTFDGLLTIRVPPGTTYWIRISYDGNLDPANGLFVGSYEDSSYIGMNLYPTNARRVFPCVDEPTETSVITFSVNEVPYGNIISNTQPIEGESTTSFMSMAGAPFRWALFAHDFRAYNLPVENVQLSGRSNLNGQESLASVAINIIFGFLNEWTNKPYMEIVLNQANNMQVIAIPDTDVEWHTLSVIGLWEPYIMMPTQQPSIKQNQVGLVKIAEALTRPWFGFSLIPENWIHQWIITGLQTYAAYEALLTFDTENPNAIDFNAIFVTDVIRESLYRDGYGSATILQPEDPMNGEVDIRNHINNGLLKYKAPALMSMLRLVLGDEEDFVKLGAQGLLVSSHLNTVNTFNFLDNIVGPDVEMFLNPYIRERGCPLLTVTYQSNLVTVVRSTFNFAGQPNPSNFFVPITFTTSLNPEFENVFPESIYNDPTALEMRMDLLDDEWILFNIQGKGYYRVNYNPDMWERIIGALWDPDRRNDIHPLNRATLLDDALNLARRLASGLNYDVALRMVLSMYLEKDYSVWKMYIRNMNFIKKNLDALVQFNEELDPTIYLRLIRRIMATVEEELGLSPGNEVEPSMDTLTRGMVMDHACRAGYEPCIAAAIDWFYADNGVLNLNIPRDLRPAVYCTMVREGEDEVRDMLSALLEEEEIAVMYDRVVILESLACSQDEFFIEEYLGNTVSDNSPYTLAERIRIFKAVAESSYNNAVIAFRFLRENINQIRNNYGGSAKLEEALFILADNLVDNEMVADFRNWLANNNLNNLQDSEVAAHVINEILTENLAWTERHLQTVYDWIEENDATTAAVSMILLCITAFVTLFN